MNTENAPDAETPLTPPVPPTDRARIANSLGCYLTICVAIVCLTVLLLNGIPPL